jgi:hypothetical protein
MGMLLFDKNHAFEVTNVFEIIQDYSLKIIIDLKSNKRLKLFNQRYNYLKIWNFKFEFIFEIFE